MDARRDRSSPVKTISQAESQKLWSFLLELGRGDVLNPINPIAYYGLVDHLHHRKEVLNEYMPDQSGPVPLFHYLSLTPNTRRVIINNPGLHNSITTETLNYRHNEEVYSIEYFITTESLKFVVKPDILTRIPPEVLTKTIHLDVFFKNKPELFYVNSTLSNLIVVDTYFAGLNFSHVKNLLIKHPAAAEILLTHYPILREVMLRSPNTVGLTIDDEVLDFLEKNKIRWLITLLETDKLRESAITSASLPPTTLVGKIASFFHSGPLPSQPVDIPLTDSTPSQTING